MTDAQQANPGIVARIRLFFAPAARRFDELRCQYPWLEPVRKVLVTFIGIVLILGGIAVGWLPGPGGFIGFFGVAILAAEYRWVRKLTRQSEAVAHHWHKKVTGHKPRWWFRSKKRFTSKFGSATPPPKESGTTSCQGA